MSMQSEGKDAKGRNYDQVTDGSTSIATMGAGSTGEVGASAERKDPAQREQSGSQQAGRTDDLLAGGSGAEQGDRGFQGQAQQQGGQAAAGDSRSVQRGAQSSSQSGSQLNSQASAQGKDLKGAAETDDDQYDQGTARREGQP